MYLIADVVDYRLTWWIGGSDKHNYLTQTNSPCMWCTCIFSLCVLIIDRVAGAIIRLVAYVCPSGCLWALSCLNRLTFDLDFWHESRP